MYESVCMRLSQLLVYYVCVYIPAYTPQHIIQSTTTHNQKLTPLHPLATTLPPSPLHPRFPYRSHNQDIMHPDMELTAPYQGSHQVPPSQHRHICATRARARARSLSLNVGTFVPRTRHICATAHACAILYLPTFSFCLDRIVMLAQQ